MRVCNQIPRINSVMRNTSNTNFLQGNLNNSMNNTYHGYNNMIEYGNNIQDSNYIYSRNQTLKCFNYLNSEDYKTVIFSNIFSNFVPNWNDLKNMERDNIYNSYVKFARLVKGISNKTKVGEEHNKNFLEILKSTTCQIEMLFVMSTLVGCKRKNEIQDKLSKERIIEILDSYLEFIEWGNIFNESNRPIFNANEIDLQDDSSYHGTGCNCDSDHALKIQFLRFIYTYCCRDNINLDNKLKLISIFDIESVFCPIYLNLFYSNFLKKHIKYRNDPDVMTNKTFEKFLNLAEENFDYKKLIDLACAKNDTNMDIDTSDGKYCISDINDNKFFNKDTLKEINSTIQKIILSCSNLETIQRFINNYDYHSEKVGLLYKLIIKYIQECHYSSSKFWLASCIEVMLRGNNTFIQFYIGSCTGLMPCLIYDILYAKTEQTQILQISFDILGELIKFNKANYLMLNYYFVDNNEFSSFTKKIVNKSTLVDSNVFLRSIIISINYFDEEDYKLGLSKDSNEYFSQNCKFCGFIQKNYKDIFYSLINIIKPNDINQTNISCINSALLILILKNFKQEMGLFLNVNNCYLITN